MQILNYDKLVSMCEKYAPLYDTYANGEYYKAYADGLLNYDIYRYVFVSKLFEYFSNITTEDASIANEFIQLFVDNKTTLFVAQRFFSRLDINRENIERFKSYAEKSFLESKANIYNNIMYYDFPIKTVVSGVRVTRYVHIKDNAVTIRNTASSTVFNKTSFNFLKKYNLNKIQPIFKPKLKIDYIHNTNEVDYFTSLYDVSAAYKTIINSIALPTYNVNLELTQLRKRLVDYTSLEMLQLSISENMNKDLITEVANTNVTSTTALNLANNNIYLNDRDMILDRLCNDALMLFNEYLNSNIIEDEFIDDTTSVDGVVNFTSRRSANEAKFSIVNMLSLHYGSSVSNDALIIPFKTAKDMTYEDFKYYLYLYNILKTIHGASKVSKLLNIITSYTTELIRTKNYINQIQTALAANNKFERI